MNQKVYFFCTSSKSYGVRVIYDNLKEVFLNNNLKLELTETPLDEFNSDSVIPYGIRAITILRKKKIFPRIAIFADSMSLGYLNKIVFYSKHLYFNYDLFYSIYGFLKWKPYERMALKMKSTNVFFSKTDIDYSKKLNNNSKYYLLMNGVFPPIKSNKMISDLLRIGILGAWDDPIAVCENNYFIQHYFPYFRKTINKKCILRIAGRGKYIYKYNNHPGIEVLGKVDKLESFFNEIDVFVSPNPKGCGILNKVLEAFSYGTYVIGHTGSFSGLKHFSGCYSEFTNRNEFIQEMLFFTNNKTTIDERIHLAQEIVKSRHNWTMNYTQFFDDCFGKAN